jgi:hypothetical protein
VRIWLLGSWELPGSVLVISGWLIHDLAAVVACLCRDLPPGVAGTGLAHLAGLIRSLSAAASPAA